MDKQHLVPGDPILIENIVNYLKAKGIFDEFRHECLADVDTKSSCQNLSQRVDGYTTKFLSGEKWHPDLNKNELRNKLRRHIDESGMLAGGADHVVEQVINPKINQLFLPRIIEVVHQYLNEENEKLNKRKENSNDNISFEKLSAENTDGTNKTKSTKLDPVADILSFSYSKPKSNPPQNVQTKVLDSTKAERKKDENVQQIKLSDALPKTEKKKEELINPIKVSEVISKAKKEDAISDIIQNIEKDKEEIISIKTESVEPVNELSSPISGSQIKLQSDSKEIIKIKKDIKTEDLEVPSDIMKKTQKEDIKIEKKKSELEKRKEDSEKRKDDFKPNNDSSSHSEEGSQNKVVPSAPKCSNVLKTKSEAEKNKKVKLHNSSKTLGESQKAKSKDSDKFSGKSSDKHKTFSKVSKDHPSPLKNSITSKSSKSDKTEDSNKNKSKDGHSKSSDNSVSKPSSSKSSIKKESSSMKLKPSEKTKTSKSLDLKSKIKIQNESSEKTSKNNLHYSSYDSSQGSDQDKSFTPSSHHKEKHKHFSKHHKKESDNKKSSEKVEKTPDKKRFQSDSDSGTPIKHKYMKHVSEKEKKKSMSIQESAKISSRSNSFGSTSSVSDSPSSSKETSVSTSEETSDNSLKSSEVKKKQGNKDNERCKRTEDFSPPPPPPPSSGISAPSSAEVSSMDETQSSQESESDSKLSEDESSSESDVENLYSSNSLKNSNLQSRLKTPEILNDVYDVFLYSSSSSEFEGYSSTAEKDQTSIKQIDDIDVSSVHTSDLSSFDDLLSESEYSDIDEDRPARRLTIKEAEKLLEEKARQRRLERSKNVRTLGGSLDDKKSNTSPQAFPSSLLFEDELSPVPEPKRESRRERKLNPKYASSEYASIFNSKKTSFITKHMNPNEDKSENVSPTVSETGIQCQKDISPSKRRISMGNLEANQLSASATLQTFEFSDKAKRKLSFESAEDNSWTTETKTYLNSHERNHNMILEDIESHGSIALKIKKSLVKNDNEINKEPRPQGLKRKFDRIEKDDAKKLCRRNSDNSSSSESVPNENNPFNVKKNNPSSVFNMELKNNDFFHKQKLSNNGVVLKMEHVKKKSHPKPNHVIEKQNTD
ncbi:biorientation of chromosomes in cell division protein 1-like 1 [Argiope bruennichi]|uniref:biorientation of chromosomes in cell division protein 1-like 1 n=1 Tax=Argiope bruennichi TaxID=94029 RepID=UPI002494CBA9|nr:biorientation of chromosomes in cell division protein 1-like 1 [Argiope bruennichi]